MHLVVLLWVGRLVWRKTFSQWQMLCVMAWNATAYQQFIIPGMVPRWGMTHQPGLPGNPQGRGILARVHQTILYRIARQFETYHGTGADRDTIRQVSTAVISLDKAKRKGATQLTPKQQWAVGKLPSWNQFLDAVQAGVDWYNNEHVHSEIGMTPA